MIKPGNKAQAGESAHRPHVVVGNLAGYKRRLPVLQVDAAFVLSVRDYRHAVVGLAGQRAHLQFKLQTDSTIGVNSGLRF